MWMRHALTTFQRRNGYGSLDRSVTKFDTGGCQQGEVNTMPLLEPTLRRWIAMWTELLSGFVLIGLTLMLLFQKDVWVIPLLMLGVLIFYTGVTMYDLHHQGIERRQRMSFR